ncbi:MAG: PilZ domain-containing protein [Candidatus Omnitrophica bacterium]|nr:PilZ domain-containing protein [Candidatus Omnitrophota bacterium]
MAQKGQERRRYPRVAEKLPLKISSEGSYIVTETKNISPKGAYCMIKGKLPDMCKVEVTLLVPTKAGADAPRKKVVCTGTVIRQEPPHADESCPAALLFENISKTDERLLSKYVDRIVADY